ncbi:flavin reductase family protein [Enemella sp. A6]|uniref:flavin reductase family protein n=1 Tax=Enemella sp. A6 TaxID=3440152 RepID=UPI003EBDD0CF
MTQQAISATHFRHVLGHYPTGVVVVTGVAADGELLAMVVGTFTSVSLDPPLVAFLPTRGSRTFEQLRRCESLCINVLTGEQEQVVRTIAGRKEHKLEGLSWSPSPSGDPVLDESLAWLDVRLDSTIDAGDHWIAQCRVVDLAVHNPVTPLLFFQGGYGTFVMPSLVARMEDGIISSVQDAARVRGELEDLAREIGCEVSLLAAVSPDELASVASALGRGLSTGGGLGERIPMVPPIGDTYHSAASDAEQEAWLAKASHESAEQQQLFWDRLSFCTEHGYLMALLPPDHPEAYEAVIEATQLYATGRITPAQEREIRERILTSGIDYTPQPIDPERSYDVGAILVPLYDESGAAPLTLRLSQLPAATSGQRVGEWVEAALSCARSMERTLRACG